MTDERRYADDEVARIFEVATSPRAARGRAVPVAEGLTLGELQAIGGEVGIAPERIADAAASLDPGRGGAVTRRTQLGIPVGVGRTVDLPRAPTDREWRQLLAELRMTFGADGKDRSDGDLRAWTNGNLHAYVEPTETGQRLRLGTVKGNGVAVGWLGWLVLVIGLMVLAVDLATGGPTDDVEVAALLTGMGTVMVGANALRLPRWARKREEQMEHIAARARALIGAAPGPAAVGDGG